MTTNDSTSPHLAPGQMASRSGPRRPVVTLAALYGAGGAVVGPRAAQRLDVPFLDRGILAGVAEQLDVPEEVVAAYDDQPRRGIGRLLGSLARVPVPSGDAMDSLDIEEHRYRAETEEFLARAASGGGVVLGRGGAIVLGSVPGVLNVFLGGPRDARIQRVMEWDGVDQQTAGRRVDARDRARIDYVTRSYGVDGLDPDLYHLRIDSTAVDLDTCVELIVAASHSRIRQAAETPSR